MKLSEIAAILQCEMAADQDVEITRISGIEDARPGDLTFVSNRKYIRHIKNTRASAIILGLDIPPVEVPSLRTENPYLAFARALELFYRAPRPDVGIHPTCIIAPDAIIGVGASIGAYVVVGQGCRIGAEVSLYPHVVLYPHVEILDKAILHSRVTIREYCRIGKNVIVQDGAVIGSDGFGFAPRGDGSYKKIPQSGRVIVEDDVEIGANTTIDRAAVGDTVIRRGSKLDNLVQIGHGSQVGENCVLAAQVGVAGSTQIGRNVRIGGQAGLAGHMEVGDNAVITAQSGASHDIAADCTVSGSPVMENSVWLRSVVALPRLPDLMRRTSKLERALEQLRDELGGVSTKKR